MKIRVSNSNGNVTIQQITTDDTEGLLLSVKDNEIVELNIQIYGNVTAQKEPITDKPDTATKTKVYYEI